MKSLQSRFGGLYLFSILFLVLSLALRVALGIRDFGDLDTRPVALAAAFGVGLLYDLATLSCLAFPVALFLLLMPERLFRSKVNRFLAQGVYFAAIFIMLLEVATEWLFWSEFDSRFNFVAVDYLVYTTEVLRNFWQSYPIVPIIAVLVAVALAILFLTRRLFLKAFARPSTFRQRLAPTAVYLVAPAAMMLLVTHLPPEISANHYNNELSRNGTYSFMAALQNNTINYNQFYLTEDNAAAFGRARKLLATDQSRFLSDDPLDLSRQISAAGPEERRNVIIIVVESLSAKYLGVLGNTEGLTPNLDALADEGLLFTNFYASGTRTDRGLESLVLSIPPTPGRSMVKRPDNSGLFSLGLLFRERGYETRFLYGGHSYFDNMTDFFVGNGFATTDQADFQKDEVTFDNAWGVCDEDLLNRALVECDASQARGRPFCSLLMTTSNHRPFTYPAKIDTSALAPREGAVKYTDYALGQFFAKARTRPWFANTVFIVVADHCASSAGRAEITVEKYRIPLLVYAPGFIKPARIAKLGGQMDIAPTLLGLLKFSYRSRFYGRDMLQPGPGRALLGNYQKVGLLVDDKLALLLPDKRSQFYEVRPGQPQNLIAEDRDLLLDTMSYYQTTAYLLKHRLYTPIR